MDWPLVIAFGFGVGVLVGTTGVGGGSLMTPALILVFGTAPTTAIGTDLAYAAVTKTVGGWRHFRKGTVDMPIALWLATGSIPGALGGVYVLHRLEKALGRGTFDDTLLTMVGAALLLTSVAVLARALLRHVRGERETVEPFERKHKLAAVLIGVSVGFVLGLTSAGSGALIAVGLIMVSHRTSRSGERARRAMRLRARHTHFPLSLPIQASARYRPLAAEAPLQQLPRGDARDPCVLEAGRPLLRRTAMRLSLSYSLPTKMSISTSGMRLKQRQTPSY